MKRILLLVSSEPGISYREAAKKLGEDYSFIQERFWWLTSQGHLNRVGERGYTIRPSVTRNAKEHAREELQRLKRVAWARADRYIRSKKHYLAVRSPSERLICMCGATHWLDAPDVGGFYLRHAAHVADVPGGFSVLEGVGWAGGSAWS